MFERPVHSGKHDSDLRAHAIGYPDFLAIQDIEVTFFPRSRLHAGGVGTGIRFGECVAADPFTSGKAR